MARSSHHTSSSNWRQIVTSIYPDALIQTYCVPPVNFNKVSYVRDTVPGTGHSALVLHPPSGAAPVHNAPPVSQRPVQQSAYSLWTQESEPQAIPVNVQESDFRDDFAQNHVMLNLQELCPHEAMFILSQLNFGDYLNQPAYAAAAAQLPRPSDIDTQQTKYSDGEADFVLIHRNRGILIGELKSVGMRGACAQNPQPPADADVAKRVTKAVKQLDRSEIVVSHLLSDVATGLIVKKTIFLPYVSVGQLKRVLDNDLQLKQAVCGSLGAANAADVVKLCCCSDQLSQPASYWDVTPAVLSQLSTWWQHRMACTVDTLLTDDKYLDIVARFVGPATTVSVRCYNGVRVEVRTAGQAVAELGWRLALLVLTLQQLDLLNRDPQLVCLTGPPGTGKTLVLVLQGCRWLAEGEDVQVVSSRYESQAVCIMIKWQLEMHQSNQSPGTVTYHQYDFTGQGKDVDKAVSELEGLALQKDGRLFVILDEAYFGTSLLAGTRHEKFISELTRRVPGVRLWSACINHRYVPPELVPEVFTTPLRSAPVVQREIQPAIAELSGGVHAYNNCLVPAPGDGLRVIPCSHGDGHTGLRPVDCMECGKMIAAKLRSLDVGSPGAPLSYRDVFILTRSTELHDDFMDDAGNVTSTASSVVRGLRDEGFLVCVLGLEDRRHNEARWRRDIADVAVAATDRVTVLHYEYVQGLERRVVVVLPGRDPRYDDGDNDDSIRVNDRLLAVSRCTTQLIMVDVPSVSE